VATVTSKVCDIDAAHGEAESYIYGFGGEFFTADLCAADASKLEKATEPFTAIGTPVSVRDLARNGTVGSYDPAVVRSWAQANGVAVAEKGRVSADVVEKWRKATSH